MKPIKKVRRKDKLEHICDLVDLEWNGMITRDELVRRLTALVDKTIIEISDVQYRVTQWKDRGDNGLYLESIQSGQDDWVQVEDLTELRIWEYNKLVDELNKHYLDYPIEYLEGRFV